MDQYVKIKVVFGRLSTKNVEEYRLQKVSLRDLICIQIELTYTC